MSINPTADPTWVDIDWDPREERMRGIARHGNTPFDVPYMSQITDNLWTGGCRNGLVLPEDILHVVSLYKWESYTVRHELRTSLTVTQYDEPFVNSEEVDALAHWVNVCRKSGPVLVHCQAGLNRSNLVAGTALIHAGMEPAQAIALLREKRSPAVLCNRTFEDWLLTA